MKLTLNYLVLIAVALSVNSTLAQSISHADLNLLRFHHEGPMSFEKETKGSSGSVKQLFLFYKHFISSQDASSCSFHPSCSVYFVHAVKRGGFIHGTLLFGDRFLRCNSLSKENYPVYEPLQLLYDPVPADF